MIALKALNDSSNPNRELTPLDLQIEKALINGEENELNKLRVQTPVTTKYYRQMLFKEVLEKVKVVGLLSIHISCVFLFRQISQEQSPDI